MSSIWHVVHVREMGDTFQNLAGESSAAVFTWKVLAYVEGYQNGFFFKNNDAVLVWTEIRLLGIGSIGGILWTR